MIPLISISPEGAKSAIERDYALTALSLLIIPATMGVAHRCWFRRLSAL